MESRTSGLRPMLTAPQVAEFLSVPVHRVYELARLDILRSVRIGRQLRFDPQWLREWVDAGGTAGDDVEQLADGDDQDGAA